MRIAIDLRANSMPVPADAACLPGIDWNSPCAEPNSPILESFVLLCGPGGGACDSSAWLQSTQAFPYQAGKLTAHEGVFCKQPTGARQSW